MAVYDHKKASIELRGREKYAELLEWLKNCEMHQDGLGGTKSVKPKKQFPIPDHIGDALAHIKMLEKNLEKQKEIISNYQKFFMHLDSLLPHRPSTSDIIG